MRRIFPGEIRREPDENMRAQMVTFYALRFTFHFKTVILFVNTCPSNFKR